MLSFIYLGLEHGLQIPYSVPYTLHLLGLKYSSANKCTFAFLVFLKNLGLYTFFACMHIIYILLQNLSQRVIISKNTIIRLSDSGSLSHACLFVTWASDTRYLMPMAGDLSFGC